MPIFDTHGHYNLEPLASDWQKYWAAAQNAGIKQSLIVGASLHSSRRAVEIAQKTSGGLWSAIGLHPSYFLANDENDPQWHPQPDADLVAITELARKTAKEKNSRLRAIGETGLEYFRLTNRADFEQIRQTQIKLFNQQIELANELKLPLTIHNRDAGDGQTFNDILNILRTNPPQNGFILHCFAGTREYLKSGLKLGAYISFAGNITFKNAGELRELIKIVPADRLLIETDAPFLSPEPHRGQFCQPAFIADTLRFITMHFPQFSSEQIYENSCRVFEVRE